MLLHKPLKLKRCPPFVETNILLSSFNGKTDYSANFVWPKEFFLCFSIVMNADSTGARTSQILSSRGVVLGFGSRDRRFNSRFSLKESIVIQLFSEILGNFSLIFATILLIWVQVEFWHDFSDSVQVRLSGSELVIFRGMNPLDSGPSTL